MPPLTLTYKTLLDVHIIRLMIACAALAVVVVLCFTFLFTWIISSSIVFESRWLNHLFTWSVGIITSIGSWFMLPALTVLIGGAFQEKVIHRTTQLYYSDSSRIKTPRFWPDFFHDIKFTLKALSLNLLLLPLYFIGLGFIFSILLNSYLLGCEFFESVAGYHLGKTNARALRVQNRRIIYIAGGIITIITLMPILNMFAPIIAIVMMVHIFHHVKTPNEF